MLDIETAMRNRTDRERARKAASKTVTLAQGARSQEESNILTALRKEPATSVSDLRSRAKINNDLAFEFAYNALRDRGMIRETAAGYFGVTKIIATEMADN